MKQADNVIFSAIEPSKYYAPELDDDRHIFRKRLINTLLHRQADRRRIIVVEAQAGQGKSIFAVQFVDQLGADFIWYQLGPEDGETPIFATGLLCALASKFPNFESPRLEELINSGEAGLYPPRHLASLLSDALAVFFKSPLYLVFDDVYLLDGYTQSLEFLSALLELAPAQVRFILTSRHPVEPAINTALPLTGALRVNNASLALSKAEVGELFHNVLATPISRKMVQRLHTITEGWVMGLILLGQTLQEGLLKEESTDLEDLLSDPGQGILDYFRDNLLSRFPEPIRRLVLKVSLLDRIPVDLAGQFGEVDAPLTVLRELSNQNFFLRPLDTEHTGFVFHHLFGDYLQDHARNQLSKIEVDEVYQIAARWHLEKGQQVDALNYYLAARDFVAVDRVLMDFGVKLQANNRIMVLHKALSQIPATIVRDQAWISYFLGISQLDHDPSSAIENLNRAMEIFTDTGDEFGEILVMTQLLLFHVLLGSEFNKGAPYLERLQVLFTQHADELEIHLKVQAAYALAAAHIWITCDLEMSDHYSTMALQWARQADMENYIGGLAIMRISRWFFGCNFKMGMRECDEFAPLMESPRVSEMHKSFMFGAWVNFLGIDGDFDNYIHQKNILLQRTKKNFRLHSVIAPLMAMWDCDIALAKDDLSQALLLVRQSLGAEGTAAMPHMRSMFFHKYALILAMQGREDEARAAISESLKLRDHVGGKWFIAVNRMFIGAAFAQLNAVDEAEHYLGVAIELSKDIDQQYILIAVYAYRAFLRSSIENEKGALEDVCAAVDLLEVNGFNHVYGWHPEIMGFVFSTAVKAGHRTEFVRNFAARRLKIAILPNGERIKLLTIRTLGPMTFSITGQRELFAGDFTESQRQLLALILASPGLQCLQEKAQEALWPNEEPDKSRRTFDTLLARLRSRFDSFWGPGTGKRYLALQGGIISIQHALSDVSDFYEAVNQGIVLANNGENWQAGNFFRRADLLWTGPFLESLDFNLDIDLVKQQCTDKYIELSFSWSRLLAKQDDLAAATRIAEAGFRQNLSNDVLARHLHDLHIQVENLPKARRVVQSYQNALGELGHSSIEVDEFMEAFWEV